MTTTVTIQQSYNASGQAAQFSHSFTDTMFETLNESILTGNTLAAGITIDVSEITVMIMTSDQAVTITSQNGSQAAIVLAAGVPYIWTTSSYFTNKLTHDVTTLSVENASGSTADFKLYVLLDSTP